jgi:hypothetical protein
MSKPEMTKKTFTPMAAWHRSGKKVKDNSKQSSHGPPPLNICWE